MDNFEFFFFGNKRMLISYFIYLVAHSDGSKATYEYMQTIFWRYDFFVATQTSASSTSTTIWSMPLWSCIIWSLIQPKQMFNMFKLELLSFKYILNLKTIFILLIFSVGCIAVLNITLTKKNLKNSNKSDLKKRQKFWTK